MGVGKRYRRRRAFLATLLALCFFALAAPATSSAAWSQLYCDRVLEPLGRTDCASHWPHSLDRGTSWYTGLASHHVETCTFIFNLQTNQIRGNITACKWSDVGDGVASVQFGATTEADYRAWAYLNRSCCPHTVGAWTRTTY
jgi:hypothetical protein